MPESVRTLLPALVVSEGVGHSCAVLVRTVEFCISCFSARGVRLLHRCTNPQSPVLPG